MDLDEKLTALRRCPILARARDDVLTELARAAAPESFEGGSLVFDVGDATSEVYVVVSGHLRARLTADGQLVSVFQPGSLFGEYAMFTGGTRSARVTAPEPCELLVIDPQAFRRFLLATPEAALDLLQTAVRRLARAERPQSRA